MNMPPLNLTPKLFFEPRMFIINVYLKKGNACSPWNPCLLFTWKVANMSSLFGGCFDGSVKPAYILLFPHFNQLIKCQFILIV